MRSFHPVQLVLSPITISSRRRMAVEEVSMRKLQETLERRPRWGAAMHHPCPSYSLATKCFFLLQFECLSLCKKKRQIGACKKNTRSFGALSSFFFFLLVGSKERQIWQFPTNVNWRMVSGLFFHKIFTLHQEWGLTLSFHE